MKRVYSSENAFMAWHVRNMLEQEGIRAEVRNAELYSVSGEVPTVECWPEVWVLNKLDYDRAQRLISEMDSDTSPDVPEAAGWTCPACGESCGVNFDICWNCQTARERED